MKNEKGTKVNWSLRHLASDEHEHLFNRANHGKYIALAAAGIDNAGVVANSSAVFGATAAEAQARLTQIEAVLKTQEVAGTVDETDHPLNTQVITRLCSQYFDLISRERDWSMRFWQKSSCGD